MFEMGSHDPIGHMRHKLWPNERSGVKLSQIPQIESNWQFDSRPVKVKNRFDFLVCRWHATYRWKGFDEGYNFALDLISIGGLHT
jgi:hypothetical protein